MRSRSLFLGPACVRPWSRRPGNSALPSALRLRRPARDAVPADPLARDAKTARVEAVLLVADEPLTARRIAEAAGLADAAEARRALDALRQLHDTDGTAFHIEELAGGYQLRTRPAFHPWLLRLRRTGHELRLTGAGLETLAVIAYKQPITRADIEAIRGVQCHEVIRVLMEKGMVRIAGRHNSLGRPQLYGTTRKFLQTFGLNSLRDLPEVESLKQPE